MPLRPKTREPKSAGEEERPPESSTSRRLTSRTRISAACEACKKRKTKCSGEPLPCQLCQVQGTECVIDLSRDMRRREAMQQTLSDSKSHLDALNDLIDCIRGGSDEMVQSLREFLQRDDVAKQELFDTIRTWAETTRIQETNQDAGMTVPAGASTNLSYRFNIPLDEAQASRLQQGSMSREGSLLEDNPSHFEYLSTIHRYLKLCTKIEGIHILDSLLKARNVAEAIEAVPSDSLNVNFGQDHDKIDPSLQSASLQVDHAGAFWHSTPQQGMSSTYTPDGMSESAWSMSTQIPWTLGDQPQQGPSSQASGQAQDNSRYRTDQARMFPPRR